MKKFIALVLAVVTAMSCSMIAFAESTTKLTTTVPNAAYTLNIPANQEIQYGVDSAAIGAISVTDSEGFGIGKDLKLTINYSDFASDDESITTTIPYKLYLYHSKSEKMVNSDASVVFKGTNADTVNTYVQGEYLVTNSMGNTSTETCDYTNTIIKINASDWSKALPGDYSSIITFTTEVILAK